MTEKCEEATRPIDRSSTTVGSGLSAFAALFSFVVTGFYSWGGLLAGAVGLVLLLAGLVRGTTAPVTIGGFGLVIAGIVAGAQGAPVVSVLAGVVFAVIAWDAAGLAIGLGKQLGRGADTTRLELFHVAGSLAVGIVSAGIGYAIYVFATGGQPVGAVVFLLVGTLLLLVVLE
ncbi:hypothetical protein AArcSl_2181 [Halalkaliarchaeum desulfuricum]|uniref:Uncharacterized protein n=1 Tax=Halalkaliarchaeum desulfuricum TaxID=2055893 RepID=A0A343TL34_9EURY|nr:hypothetical protein [Halalkaliarchaeum desulfuricum]AUX09806.1 hypothetical protein AArcSl_2181 [Halalkaliarchaeum desulfuricum]